MNAGQSLLGRKRTSTKSTPPLDMETHSGEACLREGKSHRICVDQKHTTCASTEPDPEPENAGIDPLIRRYQAVQQNLRNRTRDQLGLRGQAAEFLPTKARNSVSNIVLNARDMGREKREPPTRSRQQKVPE